MYLVRRAATTFSNILDRNERFDIGRKLLSISGSRDSFFKSGFTRACLKQFGTEPSVREVFIIFVMVGESVSRQDFNSGVGIGSRSQLELLEFRIILETSDTLVSQKLSREEAGFIVVIFVEACGGVRMLVIWVTSQISTLK